MKFLIFLLLFSAANARADYFAGAGTGLRTRDQSANGPGISRIHAASVGYLWTDWSAQLEAIEIRHESGAGNTLVSSRQLDTTAWLRRHLAPHAWNPFLALGFGIQQEKVDTHFNQTVTSNTGENVRILGIGLGVQAGRKDSVGIAFEIRYLSGSGLRTVTLYESVTKLVYQF
ncbi:MAG: hypothetical protein ABL958_19900 [Bdellovibrionia bacterium]